MVSMTICSFRHEMKSCHAMITYRFPVLAARE